MGETRIHKAHVALIGLCLVLAGCSSAGGGAAAGGGGADARRDKATAVAAEFGKHVVAGDWASAHGLLTAAAKAKVTEGQLKAEYEKTLAEIMEVTPQFKINASDSSAGEDSALITSDSAREQNKAFYALGDIPAPETWLYVGIASIGYAADPAKNPVEIEQGIDAYLFVVDEAGTPKIAAVYWDFMD